MKKGFWKSYFNIMQYCFKNNGKIKTIIIFSNPIIIWIMFVTYLNLKGRYNYVD